MIEIDQNLLTSILSEYQGEIPIWENSEFISQSIRESESQICKLNDQIKEIQTEMNKGKQEWNDLKKSSNDINKNIKRIKEIHQQMEKPLSHIQQFLEDNQSELELFEEYNQINSILSVANNALLDQKEFLDKIKSSKNAQDLINICENNGYKKLLNIIKNKINVAESKEKSGFLPKLEKILQDFAVTNSNALNQIFLTDNSPASYMSKEFQALIDELVSIDREWEKTLIGITKNVFLSRIVYHSQSSDITSTVSFISLIVGLLRIIIQSIFVIMNYPEKLSPNANIFNSTTLEILKGGANEILSKNDGSCIFYRNIFEQANILDQWLKSIDYYNFEFLCSLLFSKVGNEWIEAENLAIQALMDKSLLEENMNDNFPLTMCAAISNLDKSIPKSLTSKQKKIFIQKCIIHSEKIMINKIVGSYSNYMESVSSQLTLKSESEKSFSKEKIQKLCIFLNSLLLISTQLSEIYEIEDGEYQDILQDSKSAKNECIRLCQNLAENVFSIFEKEGGNYLITQTLRWRNGAATPSLSSAISAVSQPLSIIKSYLDPTLYNIYFISKLGRSIDSKVYKMVIRKVDWSTPHSINQFVNDLDAMINAFGTEELRLLRSAKMFLTSQEEKYLNYEIPEEDVEIFIMASKNFK